MNLTDAEHLLKRWDPSTQPASPRIIEALDMVQFEHHAAEATARFPCPTCGAQAHEACKGEVAHHRRIDMLLHPRSTRTIGDATPAEPSHARRESASHSRSAFA